MSIVREVDALEECQRIMTIFEEKYGISSKDFYEGNYVKYLVSKDDLTAWKFYIINFLRVGGKLESR